MKAATRALLRWLLPSAMLFAALVLLAWKVSRTAARPFVYDLDF